MDRNDDDARSTRMPLQALVVPFRRAASGVEFAVFRRADAGYWQVVAGGAEVGETPLDAARREAREEAGIPPGATFVAFATRADIPVHHFAARVHWPADMTTIPGHYFAADATGIDLVLSAEHTEFIWADANRAAELVRWDSDRAAIRELAARLTRP